ncbi:GNAT family N-acetyltransferase [Falsiphaeobacter marinintestinus]|uniref:GNAT family N-acetyltransferase n=1 Tax=Falsiphaeobacter marinintestinus TaxID=1492905 RepID=UPI0011B55DBD|nr:GNAT family N-acetyltransferase [Phaeobacter marinintestinus]
MPVIPTLETDRLILRGPSMDDFEPFAAFYASDRAKFVGGPLDKEGSWRMLAMEIGHWMLKGYGRWTVALKDTTEPIGMIGPFCPHGWPEPEIGWDLFNGYEGKGFATEAAVASRDYAYDILGWDTAISLVKYGNDKSAALALRLGAKPDGDFTHDRHGLMQVYRHPAPQELTDGGIEAYS